MTFQPDTKQLEAIEMIASERFGILTGGPGTGKTSTVNAALARLNTRERFTLLTLCAPTGKAAKRLSEVTRQSASTVHRLLGVSPPGSGQMWTHFHGNALPYEVIIVDEASMLDTELAAALLDAVSTQRTRLFFVGDANQLPSVGPGNVLRDLIASGRCHVVTLETVHRQAEKSWVNRNAPRILAGDAEGLELRGTFDDFTFVEEKNIERIPDVLVEVMETELDRIGTSELTEAAMLDKVQVLCPQNVGPIGTEVLNKAIQTAIHGYIAPDTGFAIREDLVLASGDKVIQTKNNYALEVMNGETGIVVGRSGTSLVIDFDDGERSVTYQKKDTYDLQLGYAISIHRSQGSEWPTTIVMCHSGYSRMLNRQLFYTACTRARGRLVVIGDVAGVERAVRTEMVSDRQTRLKERLAYVMDGG